VVEVGEVERADGAALGARGIGFLVEDDEFAAGEDVFEEGGEVAVFGGVEGGFILVEHGAEIGGGEGEGGAGEASDFFEGYGEGVAERGAAPGGEGAASEHDGERLFGVEAEAAGEIEGGGVAVAFARGIPLDGGVVKIAEALDVAFNGAGREFVLAGKGDGIDREAGGEAFVELKYPRGGGGADSERDRVAVAGGNGERGVSWADGL